MVNVQIQKKFNEGFIVGEINIDGNGIESSVHIVCLHSTFDSGVPRHPTLELINSKWMLVAHYYDAKKGQVHEPIDNKYAHEIVSIILEKKEEQTPNFGK